MIFLDQTALMEHKQLEKTPKAKKYSKIASEENSLRE